MSAGVPSMAEHSDLLVIVIGVLFTITSALIVRTLNKIDKNQNDLHERMSSVEKDLYCLLGEHYAHHARPDSPHATHISRPAEIHTIKLKTAHGAAH